MKLPPALRACHDYITDRMAKSWFVENILIAKITEEDGLDYDCIYCTIIRNAILFSCIGFIIGYFLG